PSHAVAGLSLLDGRPRPPAFRAECRERLRLSPPGRLHPAAPAIEDGLRVLARPRPLRLLAIRLRIPGPGAQLPAAVDDTAGPRPLPGLEPGLEAAPPAARPFRSRSQRDRRQAPLDVARIASPCYVGGQISEGAPACPG